MLVPASSRGAPFAPLRSGRAADRAREPICGPRHYRVQQLRCSYRGAGGAKVEPYEDQPQA